MVVGKVRKLNKRRFDNKSSLSTVQKNRLNNYHREVLEALEKYAIEIDSAILAYNKKSCEETMMMKGLRKSNQETTNRKTHMENVEGIATTIAKKLGLCEGVVRVIARNHDIRTYFPRT